MLPPGIPAVVHVLTLRDRVEHAERVGHLVGGDHPTDGGDATTREPAVVGLAQPASLVDGGRQVGVVPRRQRARRRLLVGVDHVGMIDEHRTRLGVEQGERSCEHVVLELGIGRSPSGRPSGNSQWRARGGAIFTAIARTDDRTTVAIPAASNTWASTLTVRVHSGQTGVKITTSTPSARKAAAAAGPVSSRIVDDVVGLVAGERDVPRSDGADDTALGEFLEAIDRVHDVEVHRHGRVVEVRAPVAHHEVTTFSVDQPVAGVARSEAVVTRRVQRRRGDDGDGRVGQRRWRHPRRIRELRPGQRRRMGPHHLVAVHVGLDVPWFVPRCVMDSSYSMAYSLLRVGLALSLATAYSCSP